jgi:hypothetical protein
MGVMITPTQDDVQTVLRSFLLAVFPGGNASFIGWIAGTTLTVTSILDGVINVGDQVLGAADGTPSRRLTISEGGFSFNLTQNQASGW